MIIHPRFNAMFADLAYLKNLIKDSFENDCVGDDNDRWAYLQNNFQLKEQFDVLE